MAIKHGVRDIREGARRQPAIVHRIVLGNHRRDVGDWEYAYPGGIVDGL